GGKSASVFLFVAIGPVDLLTLTPGKASLIAGQSLPLHAYAFDAAGSRIRDAVVAYTSSNPDVARVDANGVVTAVSAGSTVITGTSGGKSTAVAVRVLAATTRSWVRFDSDPGDWVGQGYTYSYTSESSSIIAQAKGVKLNVYVAGGEGWIGNMAIPDSLGRLTPGTYQWLSRIDFSDPAKGGIYWSSDSRGCNEDLGSITIDSVHYTGDTLDAIDLRFVNYCDGGPALRGIIHWRAEPST
ncbi:MAG TPA: Ig-like domain-containing protein, partial [Gemmatimonadaceae bacterium]